jgi:hypothetical protein
MKVEKHRSRNTQEQTGLSAVRGRLEKVALDSVLMKAELSLSMPPFESFPFCGSYAGQGWDFRRSRQSTIALPDDEGLSAFVSGSFAFGDANHW